MASQQISFEEAMRRVGMGAPGQTEAPLMHDTLFGDQQVPAPPPAPPVFQRHDPRSFPGVGNLAPAPPVERLTTGGEVGVASSADIYPGESLESPTGSESSATAPSERSQLYGQAAADYAADRQGEAVLGGAMNNNIARERQALAGQKSAIDEGVAVDQAKSKSLEAPNQEALDLATEHAKRVEKIEDDARRETDQQMNRIKAAAQQASLLQMKDFWADKTTGARIMGVISQALAGAANGLSGQPGAPTPLDRIINQDFELQKAKLDSANTKVYQEKTVLDSIHGEVNSKIAAESAWMLAANDKVKQMVATIDNLYKTPTSKAAADKLTADLDAKQASHETDITKHLYDEKVQEKHNDGGLAAILAGQETSENVAKIRSGRQNALGWTPPGMKDTVPNSPRVNAAAKDVDTIVQLNELLKGALDAMNTGGVKKYYEYMAIQSKAFSLGRKDAGAGANLQGPEEGMINVFAPNYWKTIRADMTPEDARKQITAAQRTLMRSLRGKYMVLKKDYTPDFDDPSVGNQLRDLQRFEMKYRRPGT